ncbi:RDD family protein [Streptomyces sp. NBC_01476]|uniref:RDD family protein n=1 Tax=Streptomyces sp. NBC_01476 TaxID=2903881 RepID=UPI002E3262E1|nr:RDD family protein [Streptomyces sp. NBC_01476]
MSSDQPGPGSPDDPFAKPPGNPYGNPPPGDGGPYGQGGPHGAPPPGDGGFGQDPYGRGPQDPFGGDPYPGGPQGPGPGPDPLAGMPPLAPAGRRIFARIVDVVVVLIPGYLLEWAVVGMQDGSDVNWGRSAVGGVFTAGIGFFYEWLMTRSTGQTLGKRAMGLRTAMLADGDIPTSNAAALRAAVLWVPVFCCYCVWFLLIGITVAFDKPYKQGLHDKAAKTVVVQVV